MTTNLPNTLTALAPLDGRYAKSTGGLRRYFSEFALIHYRVVVEVRWLLFLSEHEGISECPTISGALEQVLLDTCKNFSLEDAAAVKEIEATTNHDVKAVEYFLRKRLHQHKGGDVYAKFVHFACTSEDINNLAYALMMRDFREQQLLPALATVQGKLSYLIEEHSDLSMMSRTHGQTASPTTLGKEVRNVHARMERQIERLNEVDVLGKMNGAVGNYNAHLSAYSSVDWLLAGKTFVESLGLAHNPHTTQIEPHDWMAEFFHSTARINTILTDWCRDVWGYISLGYFRQIAVAGEVGSSTMPHKINPIQFENAEGNFGLANALLNHLAGKLPISRWQRDLTDSTVLRNIGVAFAWGQIGYDSLNKGMDRLGVDADRIAQDLTEAWEVLAEPVQTVMKRYGIEDAYEQLKALTRGQAIDRDSLTTFINTLSIPEEARRELLALTPTSYTGLAGTLARQPSGS